MSPGLTERPAACEEGDDELRLSASRKRATYSKLGGAGGIVPSELGLQPSQTDHDEGESKANPHDDTVAERRGSARAKWRVTGSYIPISLSKEAHEFLLSYLSHSVRGMDGDR